MLENRFWNSSSSARARNILDWWFQWIFFSVYIQEHFANSSSSLNWHCQCKMICKFLKLFCKKSYNLLRNICTTLWRSSDFTCSTKKRTSAMQKCWQDANPVGLNVRSWRCALEEHSWALFIDRNCQKKLLLLQ